MENTTTTTTTENAAVEPNLSVIATETTVPTSDTQVAVDVVCVDGRIFDGNGNVPADCQTSTTLAPVAEVSTSNELPSTGNEMPLKLGVATSLLFAGSALLKATRRTKKS